MMLSYKRFKENYLSWHPTEKDKVIRKYYVIYKKGINNDGGLVSLFGEDR